MRDDEYLEKIIIDEKEEHPLWIWTKRLLFAIVALFLFYLMFTYMGIGPDVLQVFEGQAASDALDGNFTLFVDNETKVVFSEELYAQLFSLYLDNQEHEFKACLYGERVEEEYVVYYLDYMILPEIYEQSVRHVASAGCDADTLVSMHSHPYKRCLLSEQDVSTYRDFLEEAPYALLAVMCEEDRFTFYRE